MLEERIRALMDIVALSTYTRYLGAGEGGAGSLSGLSARCSTPIELVTPDRGLIDLQPSERLIDDAVMARSLLTLIDTNNGWLIITINRWTEVRPCSI
jgi:hypothetical protein